MGATFIIDGYNLLYAIGALQGRAGPAGLEKARQRLLGLLAGSFGAEAGGVTVVFDAAGAPPRAVASQEYRGVLVRFAVHEAEADDLIEELIRHSSAPRSLTLVSDDHRLQRAARRRDCRVQGCEEFMVWLGRYRRERTRPAAEAPEKRDGLTEQETVSWVREFADLADDPAFKELFEPYEFELEE